MQFTITCAFEAAFLACLAVCGFALDNGGSAPAIAGQEQRGPNEGDSRANYREGKTVERMHGTFRVAQGRYVFFPDDQAFRFIAIENLNLERIAKVMAATTDETAWEIDAEITEFRGGNYLIIKRAQILDRQGTRPRTSAN